LKVSVEGCLIVRDHRPTEDSDVKDADKHGIELESKFVSYIILATDRQDV